LAFLRVGQRNPGENVCSKNPATVYEWESVDNMEQPGSGFNTLAGDDLLLRGQDIE
jgi:hypothetical protein